VNSAEQEFGTEDFGEIANWFRQTTKDLKDINHLPDQDTEDREIQKEVKNAKSYIGKIFSSRLSEYQLFSSDYS
jgi:hypothetical protein